MITETAQRIADVLRRVLRDVRTAPPHGTAGRDKRGRLHPHPNPRLLTTLSSRSSVTPRVTASSRF